MSIVAQECHAKYLLGQIFSLEQLAISGVDVFLLCPAITTDASTGIVLAPSQTVIPDQREAQHMNNIIYLIGLIVVVIAILSFFGLR